MSILTEHLNTEGMVIGVQFNTHCLMLTIGSVGLTINTSLAYISTFVLLYPQSFCQQSNYTPPSIYKRKYFHICPIANFVRLKYLIYVGIHTSYCVKYL